FKVFNHCPYVYQVAVKYLLHLQLVLLHVPCGIVISVLRLPFPVHSGTLKAGNLRHPGEGTSPFQAKAPGLCLLAPIVGVSPGHQAHVVLKSAAENYGLM
ncbi:MAG: hypothetical protein J7621_26890, partial [Niastella sp.]|nr:hypothetical protein [Niastella sp.]